MTKVRKVQSTSGANPLEDRKKLKVFKMKVYHTPEEFTVMDIFIINFSTFIDVEKTEYIKLKVMAQGHPISQSKEKKDTPLRNYLNAYCDRVQIKVFKLELYHIPDEFTVMDLFSNSMFTEADKTEPIKLNVTRRGYRMVQFKIKKYTPLRKLMNAYCDRVHQPMAAVKFRFDGQAIDESDTPLILKMEEGDTIEVYQLQTWAKYTSIVKQATPKPVNR